MRLGLFVVGLSLWATTAPAAKEAPPPEWWQGAKACPAGAKLSGSPPPRGNEVACVHLEHHTSQWSGRRTLWFPGSQQKRLEGEYRKGIEHGHFVFWRKDSSKGLEGDYWAGKRSGVWLSWSADAKLSRLEYPDLSGSEKDVDAAIQAALDAAGDVGSRDLAGRLDRASEDLRAGRGDTTTASSRGGGKSEVIAGGAVVGSGNLDVPDSEMGDTDFGGGETEADAFVRRAIAKATPAVTRCYERARAERAGLRGEIVARYIIEPSGKVADVRVVKSTMTESMNQCVKKVLTDLRFPERDAAAAEVISPWRFEPPSGS